METDVTQTQTKMEEIIFKLELKVRQLLGWSNQISNDETDLLDGLKLKLSLKMSKGSTFCPLMEPGLRAERWRTNVTSTRRRLHHLASLKLAAGTRRKLGVCKLQRKGWKSQDRKCDLKKGDKKEWGGEGAEECPEVLQQLNFSLALCLKRNKQKSIQ